MFEMKDLAGLHYYLVLEVSRDLGQTFLSQGKYVKSLLNKFKMDQCKDAFVPLHQKTKLQVNDGSKEVDAMLYRKLVGSLIYLTITRSGLTYTVGVLSQYTSHPHENHWVVAKGVIRYLQGTLDFGNLYSDSFDVRLEIFIDSDSVGNLDDQRSIMGYTFSIVFGVITQCSKKQHTIALS